MVKALPVSTHDGSALTAESMDLYWSLLDYMGSDIEDKRIKCKLYVCVHSQLEG